MTYLECDHIPEKYLELLKLVLENGREVKPRGQICYEISPLFVLSSSPRKRLFGTPGRNENPIFSYIETLWLLKGEDGPCMPSHYAKQTLCYLNPETGRFDGAYGPRVRNLDEMDQLACVYRRLLKDPDSRRAVVTLFDPRRDNNEDSLDVPCTISWQFMIRNGKLDMIVNMRSNDLFKGFVYDTVGFQWIQEILAGWLEVDVGRYVHVAGSAHIYLKDKSRVEKMLSRSDLSDGFSLYRTYEPQDARLPKADFDEELTKLSSMEEKSRNGMYLEIDEARETAKQFRCRFYQNLSLAILGFNARKFGHLGLASELFGFIDNELNPLMRHLVDDRERTIKDLTIPFGGPQNEATHYSEA